MPTDRYVNTFYVQSQTTPSAEEHEDIAQAFGRFYREPLIGGVTTDPIMARMPASIFGSDDDLVIKTYDMADPKIRTPKSTISLQLTGGAGVPLPTEVALCMSFTAQPQSGVPIGRRRGRVYLGPWSTGSNVEWNEGNWSSPRPNMLGIGDIILRSGVRLANEIQAQAMDWVIHSPTTGVDAAYLVAEVSVDDSWDTIRSRGLKATTRIRATINPG